MDLRGNRYEVRSKEAQFDINNPEIIKMKVMSAIFYFKDGTILKVRGNYGIYNNSSSDAVMVNNNITINGATTNVGIYNNESSPQLQEINVNVNGGSNTGYGIQNASTNKSFGCVERFSQFSQ